MKRLIFKVIFPKNMWSTSMIQEASQLPCKLNIDLQNELIIADTDNDGTLPNEVVDFIVKNFLILSVNISCPNTLEEKPVHTLEEAMPITATTKSAQNFSYEKAQDSNTYEFKFPSKGLEKTLNGFLTLIHYRIVNEHISTRFITKYILSCINELSLIHTNKECIDFSVGDVVECNYGIHLYGEIHGDRTNCIVCHIDDNNMVYVVPITKYQHNVHSESFLYCFSLDDIIYENGCPGGTALLDKGSYVNPLRFAKVIGHTTPDFFKRLLSKLSETFNFTE